MRLRTITAAILTFTATTAGLADAGSDRSAPMAGACFDAAADGLMRPFSRPGWSRSGLDGGRAFDEPRWWPIPLIAPWEQLRADSFAHVDGPPPAFCFDAKNPPSHETRQALEAAMRGWSVRYFVDTPWASRTITWSLVPDGLHIPAAGDTAGPSSLFATMDAKYGGNRALWIAHIESAFSRWANLSGITFVRVRYNGQEWDDGATWNSVGAAGLRGDMRISARYIDGQYNILAYNGYPLSENTGNMVIDTAENWGDSTNDYREFRNMLMHEIGHGIGINHVCPMNSTKLMEPALTTAFWGPQHDDMRAAHALYGDAYEPNDTFGTARPRGVLAPGATDAVGTITGTTVPSSSLISVVGSDQDWYSYDLSVPTALSISVTPVGTSYLNGPQIAEDCSGTQPSTNSVAARVLSVSVFGPDGLGLIQTNTAASAGASPLPINLSNYTGGRFYVRVMGSGTGSSTQMYRLVVSAANATPPFNDSCANAIALQPGDSTTNDNGGANTDGSATACGTTFSDVWYSVTAACTGTLVVDTCGSALDTVLSLHTACGGAAIVCNDNTTTAATPCAGPGDSAVSLNVIAGQELLIRVAGRTSAVGLFNLNVSLLAPSNDLCANATTLTLGSNINGSTCGAGREGVASCAASSVSPDVWYRHVATCTGRLVLDACASQYDTVLSVYSGTCGALSEVACNDDSTVCPNTNGPSSLSVPVTAGQAYYVRVSGFGGASGEFRLRADPAQANDVCSAATVIGPGSYTGSLCGARREAGNTCQAGSSSPDVFYSFVAPSTGVLTIDTCGSGFNTLLELSTGPCTALVTVACNNDHGTALCPGGPTTSRITANVTAGTPYTIRVSGAGGATGDFALNVAVSAVNDVCAEAITITTGQYAGSTSGAAREINDTCTPPSASGGDVFYRWVAPCSGVLILNTCGSAYDTALSVSTGACGSLTEIACNDDAAGGQCGAGSLQSYLNVAVAAGTAYTVRVSGYNGATGAFTLNVAAGASNDNCAAAAAVVAGNTPFDTRCATNDGSAICGGSNASPDVWFQFISPCNGAVWFDLCSSALDTVMTVNRGTCGGLVLISCNDNQGAASCPGSPNSSRGAIRATAGTPYLVRIAGNFGITGAGTLNIRCCPADYNLSFTVSVQDIFDFLAGYFANLPAADVNNSGTISVQDIFDFLAGYFANCP